MSCIWDYKINHISPTGRAWPEKFGLGWVENSTHWKQHHEETQTLRKFSKRNCLKMPFGWRLLQAAEVWRTPERSGLVRGNGEGASAVRMRASAGPPAGSVHNISGIIWFFVQRYDCFLARALTRLHTTRFHLSRHPCYTILVRE